MRTFAIVSLVTAVIHFIGETWWHIAFGQFLPMLIVDYIAVSLLLVSGSIYLRQSNSFGLLCGAWGFEFCLNYRALFSRVHTLLEGGGSTALEAETYFLGTALVYSALMFLVSMYLTYEPTQAAEARS